MNRIQKNIITAGLSAAILLAASAFAVTDEEIEKMRSAMPDKPAVKPERPRVMLVFSLCKGYPHSSVPYWAKAMDVMAEKTGAFTVEHSTDMAVFTMESLKRFDAICFNNTTALKFTDDQKKALMDFIKGGKGIVGIHAATDNFPDWTEAQEMMGGVFTGHPWTHDGTWAVKIDDPEHPLMKPFEGKGFKVNDEIYRTAAPLYSRDKQRVLMSLDMSDEATKNAKGVTFQDVDTGISWIKPYGKGRLFYCSLGHNHHLTWTTPVLGHFLAGIQYAMGDLKVDDAPLGTPKAKFDKDAVLSQIDKAKAFDWGQDRTALTALHEMIAVQYSLPENLKAIETMMQPLLAAETNRAVKDFACRELSVFATEISVPALAALLENPETEHMARYALERIPGKAADAVLLEKLGKVKDADTKVGIITSLGNRRCSDAVGVLSTIAIGFDKASAHAAIAALGMIGTEESAAVLQKVQLLPFEDRKQPALEALVVCADGLCRSGNSPKAAEIYASLYDEKKPSVSRVVGLKGLQKADSKQFCELLPAAVLSEDKVLQAAAIESVAGLKDTSTLEVVAGSFDKLNDSAKVMMLAALAANGNPVGKKAGIQAIGSENKEQRIAGYHLIGQVGGTEGVMPLGEAAAKATARDEKEAARRALYLLKGAGVDGAIEKGIQQATAVPQNEKLAVELIRAVGERQARSAVSLLFSVAKEFGDPIAQEALRAIPMAASAQDAAAMADLLAEKPNAAAENAMVLVAEKIADQNQRGAALQAKLDSVDSNAKAAFLRVLGKLGDANAVEVIRQMKDSADKVLSDAAFRAMTEWPDAEFIKEMKEAATGDSDQVQKVLAFRAYIRVLPMDKTMTAEQAVDALAEAMKVSARPEEQRLVLSSLGSYGLPKALQLAQEALANPELKSEAEVAVVSICEKLLPTAPDAAKAALKAIIETTKNDPLEEQAKKLID